ncbi:MAG: hypothetical protein JWN78_904 [Bacteroidota bacterium]|nr:hypothetical protein [Bacteroidota bacterium]
MKKILIALDYNPSAQKIAETGLKLAKAMKAEAVLLHVIVDATYYSSMYSPIMGYTGLNPSDIMQVTDNSKITAAAQSFLDKTKQHLKEETIDTIVKEGDFASSILETAKEVHADIIVMGSHSRRGLEKILIGSVAEKVLKDSDIPLFIIPTREHSSK